MELYKRLEEKLADKRIQFMLLSKRIDYSSKTKFKTLLQFLEDSFLSPVDLIVDTFCKIQRILHAIYRFQWIWRFQRAKTYNTEDLFMTPISQGDSNTIVLLQNNTKYVFHVKELYMS